MGILREGYCMTTFISASPDLIKKSMGESGDTEDAEEPMESLLVDPRLDEIFNENKSY